MTRPDPLRLALVAALLVVALATGCQAPLPGYGVPRHLPAVGR